MVLNGGEVTPDGLSQRIQSAEWLVFVGADPVLGVSAVKNPDVGYRLSVFEKAGVPHLEGNFQFELGWMFVSEAARGKGVGNCLMNAMISVPRTSGIYATTRSDNATMHRLFGKFSFQTQGSVYPSNNGDYTLTLYGLRA